MNQAEQQPRTLLTIESSDRDELSEYFSERVSKVAISPTSQSGDVTISATIVPLGSAVAFQAQIPLGARFRQAEDLDGFFVLLPISSGRALWKTGTKEIILSPEMAGVDFAQNTLFRPGGVFALERSTIPPAYDLLQSECTHRAAQANDELLSPGREPCLRDMIIPTSRFL